MSTSRQSDGSKRSSSKRTVRSHSGKTITLHHSLSDRLREAKLTRERRRATALSSLPKQPIKRFIARLHPKRLAQFWFSADGALMALKVIGVAIVVIFVLTIGVFAYFRKDLPKVTDVSGDNLGGSITYYDSTGKTVLWQDYDAVKRIPIASSSMANYIKQATVAIEDKDFYHEGAFNLTAIARAVLHDVTHAGDGLQGASTITQQLVKLSENWTDKRTLARKVQELILAVELSREYSKDDILQGYLNVAPYGGVEYGVEVASRDYFGIDAKDLTLAQASMLAAIPQNPSSYSPYSSPQFNNAVSADNFDREGLLGRQHYILDQMVAQHMVTAAQAADAKKVDILAQVHPLTSKYNGIQAPYFVLTAKQELEQKFTSQTYQRGGWKVTTTLNLDLQHEAERLVADNYSNIQYRTGGAADEEAMVAEDVQTGQIVALVGGTDFNNPDHGQNNYASGILIPPGSSFKPYDYTTFIDNNKNVGAGSVLYDTQGALPGYPCTNKALPKNGGNCLEDYDFIYPGPLTLRYALGGSRNVPAVKAMLSAVPNDTSAVDSASIAQTIKTATAMMDNTQTLAKTCYKLTATATDTDCTNAEKGLPSTQVEILNSPYTCYSDEALTVTAQCYGAAAIGDGAYLHLDDHVNGLSTLARLGVAIPHTFILGITDASNKAIYTWQQPQGKQVVNKDSAYIVDDMASDPNASYLPGYCTVTNCTSYKFHRYNGWHFAIKTGTTNNGFDGLMTSWSTKYAVVTWVGNHRRNVDLSAAHNTAMEYLTEPLAKGFMEYAHKGLPAVNWQQPSDIKVLPAFVVRNHIHYGDVEPSPSNDLFPSWYQAPTGTTTSQTLDKVSGKAATSCTPDAAKQIQTNSNAATFSVDKFVNGSLAFGASGSDDVHSCNDLPPSITLTIPPVCNTTCTITYTVTQGTHPLSDSQYPSYPGTVTITINGTQAYTANVSDSPSSGSFAYAAQATATGVSVKATVTDSVLYQASDTKSMDVVAPPAPGGGH